MAVAAQQSRQRAGHAGFIIDQQNGAAGDGGRGVVPGQGGGAGSGTTPTGSSTWNIVPCPRWLVTQAVPTPSGLVVKKGSKMRGNT